MLLASAFAVVRGINVFDQLENGQNIQGIHQGNLTNYSAKYRDCILEKDLPKGFSRELDNDSKRTDWDTHKINVSLKKYGQSLDSTLKNLSTIDAHNFIHKEFERSKNSLLKEDLTEIRKYYHLEIMRICYDSDKSLNLGSAGRL
jgi:hypothetical protein